MQSAPQVGHRAVSVSPSRIMAAIIVIKDTGIVCLLLSGLLLPSVLVSGQSTTTYMNITSSTTASPMNTSTSGTTLQNFSSTMAMATTNSTSTQSASMATGSSADTPTQSTMSNAYGGTVMSIAIQSSTTNSGSVSQSTHSASTTSGGPTSISTDFASPTSDGSASSSTQSASATFGGDMTVANKNTTSNSSMDMIKCPSFSCNYSDCYSMYNSQNDSACATGESCQLLKSMDMLYKVGCSASCAESCTSTSQTNCSVNCCNSTGCLNGSFASMMMMTTTTTTVAATTTTKVPPTTTSTTANNGNKCHKGTCTGETCYTNFKNQMPETCSSTKPHCQLKKETSESGIVWTAGCSNCTGYAACSETTNPPCNLECCTATTTSCLMLNGTLNVPSFATRGPYLHTELIASLVCLLAITLLL